MMAEEREKRGMGCGGVVQGVFQEQEGSQLCREYCSVVWKEEGKFFAELGGSRDL